MAFLIIKSGVFKHPPFQYNTFNDAFEAAFQAIGQGYYERGEPDMLREGETNNLYLQLGPGTVLWVMSEEAIKRHENNAREQAMAHQRAMQGLVGGAPEGPTGGFKLVIQLSDGQLDPAFGFTSRAAAENAAQTAIRDGHIMHKLYEDHHIFVQTGPGVLFMVMSNEHYQMQRRKALEAMMQQAMQNQQQGARKPLIVSS